MTVSTSRHSMPNRSRGRLHQFAAMLLAGAAICVTVDAPRAQQVAAITLNVPGGNLSTALNALAAQAKLQIVYDATITQGLRTSGVSGNLPVDAALSQLLSGTGITYRTNGRTVTLSGTAGADAAASTDSGTTNLGVIDVNSGSYYGNGDPSNAVIDEQVIARAQAASIPELVKRTPGVSMGGGVRLQGQTISIRGFGRQTDTRILLDGAPKNFEKYDQGNVFVEPELLKRVEIDKGATSVRYGNGGFGGTIRMESKDAKDMLRPGENWGAWGKTAYQTANKEFLETGALYGRSDFGTPITYDGLMSLTWRKGDDMRIGGGERYAFSDSKLTNGMMKLGAESDGHEINTSIIYGESNNWGPVAAVRGQLDIGSANINDWEAVRKRLAWRELADFTATFEYKYDSGDPFWNPRFMASYSSTQLHATRFGNQEPAASLGGLENDATYSDLHFELENTSDFTLGGLGHSLNYGLQYNRHDRDVWVYDPAHKTSAQYNFGYYALGIMPEGTQDTASAFIRDTIALTDSLTLTPGLRFDYIRSEGVPNAAPRYNNPAAGHDYSAISHDGFTPAISLAWNATSNIRLFVDWAYAMRAPNIDEIYSSQFVDSTASATSRGLLAERNNTINLGADFNFDDVMTSGDTFSARIAVFNNHVTDPVTRRFGSPHLTGVKGPVPFYWNTPSYYTSGVELQTHYETDRIFADLGLSLMTGTRHGSVNNRYGVRSYINDLAPTSANATFGVKFPDQDLSLGWTGNFVKEQTKTPRGLPLGEFYARKASPGYAIQTVFLSWTPQDGIMKDTELHAAVENIFDKKYLPYLSDGITAMPGRNFKISLSRKF